MTTDIPEEITTPDKVSSRIGDLNFFDGFPDNATIEKCYYNLDFQRGMEVFLNTCPAPSLVDTPGFQGCRLRRWHHRGIYILKRIQFIIPYPKHGNSLYNDLVRFEQRTSSC